jgi:CheY-like chemotaxis protein
VADQTAPETPDVLLVEDDAAVREGLEEALRAEGYAVRSAPDGEEALWWLLAGNRPRLLLLDLLMPRMSGEAFLAALRASAIPAPPVVLMTAARPSAASKLPAVDGLLSKPFELAELLDTVARFLGR